MGQLFKEPLWRRWVAANSLGEMAGLGLTFLVGALFFTQFGDQQAVGWILASFAVAVASGAIEATIVGLAQWWAMNPWFLAIWRRAWWVATLAGVLVAYVLGYLPSTFMSLGEQAVETPAPPAPPAEPPQWIVLLLAAGRGAVAGAMQSFFIWR